MEHDRQPVEAGDPAEKPGQITEEALQIPVRGGGVRHVEQHPVEIARRARAVIGARLAHQRISHRPDFVPENMPRVAAYVAGRSGRIHSPRPWASVRHRPAIRFSVDEMASRARGRAGPGVCPTAVLVNLLIPFGPSYALAGTPQERVRQTLDAVS